MPTVFSLQGVDNEVFDMRFGPPRPPFADLSGTMFGDGAIVTWLKARGVVVGGAIVLAASVLTGWALGSAYVKVAGDKSRSLAGHRRTGRWRKRR